MPRGKRYLVAGYTYHITHRCHNRAFLLKFRKDRATYRQMLWAQLQGTGISLLSYGITSNHVHLLLRPDPSGALESLSGLMRNLEGEFSQLYNRRKKRQNAFWGDRYHATMVDSGDYLWKCLVYIDLNMVRAGVVRHPREWPWTAYHELMGDRKRYRVIDMPELLEQLGGCSETSFRENYAYCIEEAIRLKEYQRDGKWTESLAVGSEGFVGKAGRQIKNRMRVERQKDQEDRTTWILRETPLEAVLPAKNAF